MKKRTFSLILALVLIIGLLPATAQAGELDNGLAYAIVDDHVEITYYTGSATEVVIPAEIEGLPVTSIGRSAFHGCYNLTSVTISDNVTSIGNFAFEDCESLTSVTIPDNVTSIGDWAFDRCISLTSVTIPDSVTSIGKGAFRNCNTLTSVTIPDSVTSIGDNTFYGCDSLTSVTILEGVTSIGYRAFIYCDSLTSVTIPDSVTSIGDEAFSSCDSLTSVTIPDSVTYIGEGAFSYCDTLTSVTIPDSVTSIGDWAFSYCDSLIGIWVDSDNPSYSNDASGVLLNKNQTELIQAPGAISGSYVIPSSVTAIGGCAFEDCESLTSVTIPDSVTAIGGYAFSNCVSLTSVTIPDSVTSIGHWAFGACDSLTSVTILDGVTSIGDRAFIHCFSLTSVTIPDSISSIGYSAFEGCDNLTDIYYSGTEAQWSRINIDKTNNKYLTNATIHFESEMPSDQKYNSLWIDEHLRYASSEEYESEIVPGYTGKLDNVFSDIMDDTGIKAYNLLDAVASFLNAEGSADESDLYQLILVEILYSRIDENLMQDIYANKLHTSLIDLLEFLANSEEVVSAFTDSDNYDDLLDALAILQKVDIGSGDYSKAYTSFMNTLKGNVSMSELKTSLSKNATLTALSIGLDLLFEDMKTIEDIMQYIVNCMAYEATSEEFKMVMRALANKAETMTGDAYFPRLRDYDGEIDWEAMRDAINEFVDALDAYEQKGMAAIAEEAVRVNQEADVAFTKSAVKKVAVLAFDTLVGCVPVLNICNVGVKIGVSGGKLLIDLLTDVDDCAYALEMMVRTYCFSVLMDSVADDYAGQLSEDNYTAASLFDESISVYRSVSYHASEYGIIYANAKLDDVYRRYMRPFIIGGGSRYDLEKIRWYQSDLEQLVYQQEEIQSIICHNPYLDYSPEAEPIDYCITDSKLYLVACPVEVTIRSDVYGEIAVLSDSGSVIPEGLEHYFRVIETEPGSGEFMKVAIVPEGYEVILQGTGNGTMDAAVIEYHDGVLETPEFFLDVPVTEQSEGYFDEKSGEAEADELVFDNTVHEGESGGCPFTDVPPDSFYYAPVLWALANGITTGATETTFNPTGDCKRAHVVTFLWRAFGSPEPTSTSNPFTDVKESDFYYKAVLWAVENGITTGTSATTFSPQNECSRAQVVTFLWRAKGSPASDANVTFSDVKAGQFYTTAVAWAVENGITTGTTPTTFNPTGICSRAQVVTFLYRTMA